MIQTMILHLDSNQGEELDFLKNYVKRELFQFNSFLLPSDYAIKFIFIEAFLPQNLSLT